ncbi:hypothetical protein E4T56_gene1732 [Termitomyces sp. T112]|nr:hypothetical protein E4T56_gene1732 [Termitomyces sp. T112]
MGQLHPLPIPAARWSVASVDFIVELPDAHGYDAMMVVVDLYGKQAHFIPTHTTCSALGVASLYCKNVWKLHGLHQLHPVFNVVKLFPAPEDPIPGHRLKPPPPPVLVNDEEEYEVEEILDSRVLRGKLQFKVKWKGYGIGDISWEPQANVHAPGLVRDFYHRHPNAPKAIRGIYSISPADQAIHDFFYPVRQGAAS